MTITKAQQRAVAKYTKANYDELKIRIPKGRREAVDAHAKSKGESINSLVNSLLMSDMGLSDDEWRPDHRCWNVPDNGPGD